MSKKKYISLPDDPDFSQTNLFPLQTSTSPFPPTYRDEQNFRRILHNTEGYLGVDFEFATSGPRRNVAAIAGISSLGEAAAVFATPALVQEIVDEARKRRVQLVGHSVLGAEIEVIKATTGAVMGVEEWEDSMLSHFLLNQDLCIRGDTKVVVEEGPARPIEQLVKEKYLGRVLSFDGSNFVFKPITSWIRNKRNGRKLVRVSYTNLKKHSRGKSGAIVTEDHKFLTDQGWVVASGLSGKKIATGTVGFSEREKSFLAGMGLGDGHRDRLNNTFSFMHGDAQLEYHMLLEKVFSKHRTYNRMVRDIKHTAFRPSSAIRELNAFDPLEYFEMYGTLTSLAIWYMDDGSYNRDDKYCSISVIRFSEDQKRRAVVAIENLGISCSYNGTCIYFSVENTKRFHSKIQKYIPSALQYKLLPIFRGSAHDISIFEPEEPVCFYDTAIIEYVLPRYTTVGGKKFEGDKTVYCLEIADTHNFVTLGGIVSNCKAPAKGEDDEAGALGFMNLWTATSMVLDLPNWKQCRSRSCDEVICPLHDPLGYCAIDAFASVAAFKEHQKEMSTWGIPSKVYTDLKELTSIAEQMHRQGIKVDMAWINILETKADEIKERMFPHEGDGKDRKFKLFNPRSNDQIKQWFYTKGVPLASSTKKDIRKALEKEADTRGFSTSVEGKFSTEILEQAEELPEVLDSLFRLYEFKNTGKGLDPWTSPKYRDADDIAHPRWITIGASTTRWSSARPNFQNVPARGFGALVRAAIIPRDPSLQIAKADSSQEELRMVLYLSGVDPSIIGADAFRWLVENSAGAFDNAAKLAGDTPRGIAKRISHAASLLESFTLLSGTDLMRPHTKNLIERGALRPYLKKYGAPFDWTFRERVVGFTGVNLAEGVFGSRSFENRKKALDVQELYFSKFPMIREWQKKTLDFVEQNGYVRYPTGHILRLYGTDSDDAKMACAALMQGTSAQHMQGLLLKLVNERGKIPILFVHDENCVEIPREWPDKKVAELFEYMGEEVPGLPDFRGKYKVLRGNSWLEGTKDTPSELKEKALWPLDI